MFGTDSRDALQELLADARELHAQAVRHAVALRDAGGCTEEEADEHLGFLGTHLRALEQHGSISRDVCEDITHELRSRQRANWRAGIHDSAIGETLAELRELEENRRYGVRTGLERYAARHMEECQQLRQALRARGVQLEDDLLTLTVEV